MKLRDYLGFGVDGVALMFPCEVIGRQIVQGRMAPVRVVLALDPGKDGQARFGLGSPGAPSNELALQSGKKALRHGVVIGIPNSSHGGTNTHLPALVAKSDAGVLLGFNQSSQYQLVERRIVGHSMLRQAFSIAESCAVCH